MDYSSVILRLLLGLSVFSLKARKEVYKRSRASLMEMLQTVEPALNEIEVELHRRSLEVAIRTIEADIADGADIRDPEYKPTDLDEQLGVLRRRMGPRKAERRGGSSKEAADAGDSEAVLRLQGELRRLDATSGLSRGDLDRPDRLAVLHALVVRAVQLLAGKGALTLVWMVLLPAFHTLCIIVLYWFFGSHSIFNMEIAPFAVVGTVTYYMLRTTSIRMGMALTTRGDMLSLPPVTLFDVGVTEAIVCFLIYTMILCIDIPLVWSLGLGGFPDDWVRFTALWFVMWILSMSFGFVEAYALLHWKYTRQVTPMFWRVVHLFSGVMFVSEQFPAEIKHYLLLNPLMHGLQLLRSAFFAGYKSEDASLPYFLMFVTCMAALALLCERGSRPLVQPA